MARTEPEWIVQFNARDLDGMKDSLSGYIERNYALILEASIGLGVDCNVVLPMEQYRFGQINVMDGYHQEPMRPVAYTIWKNPDDTKIFDYLLTLPQIDLGNERIVENRRWDWVEERWEYSETEPELRVACLSPFVVACGYMSWNNAVRLNYVRKLLDDGRTPLFGFQQQPPGWLARHAPARNRGQGGQRRGGSLHPRPHRRPRNLECNLQARLLGQGGVGLFDLACRRPRHLAWLRRQNEASPRRRSYRQESQKRLGE